MQNVELAAELNRSLHPSVSKLLSEMPVPVMVAGPDARIALLSARCRTLFGGDVGDAVASFWRRTGGVDAAALHTRADELASNVREDAPETAVMTLRSRDGIALAVTAHVARLEGHSIWSFAVASEDDGRATQLTELQRRVDELEQQVLTDKLTGAWTRRYLDRVIDPELARSRRYRQPVSLAVVDIDHFKRVNDTFGHAIGDVVLAEVARRLKVTARASDVVVRWGGEEFVVLAPTTSLVGMMSLGERLRAAIEAEPIAQVGTVTVSVGAAELLGQERPEEWFARADAALYSAKQSGRNRVGLADGSAYKDWDTPGVAAAVRLVWTEHLVSGEPTLDDDHQQLFRLANALLDVAFSSDRSQSKILGQLEALFEHVVAHFAREEEILASHGYGGLRGHQRLHHELIERAKSLTEAARSGALAPGRLVEFVARDVVADHLMKADRAFFPLFSRVIVQRG